MFNDRIGPKDLLDPGVGSTQVLGPVIWVGTGDEEQRCRDVGRVDNRIRKKSWRRMTKGQCQKRSRKVTSETSEVSQD